MNPDHAQKVFCRAAGLGAVLVCVMLYLAYHLANSFSLLLIVLAVFLLHRTCFIIHYWRRPSDGGGWTITKPPHHPSPQLGLSSPQHEPEVWRILKAQSSDT